MFERLPLEIVEKILFKLSPEDIRSAVYCCQRWKTIISNDDYFWKKLCQRENYSEVSESERSEFYTNFLKSYNNYWEGVYWYNDTVQRNWETSNYKEFSFEIQEEHHDYRECFFMDGIFGIVSLRGTEFYVYNWKNTEPITCRTTDDDSFFDSNLCKCENYFIKFIPKLKLAVWDLNNGSKLYDGLLPHVTDIHYDKNLIMLETDNIKFEVLNVDTKEIEYESVGICKNLNITDGRMVFTTPNQLIRIIKWDDKSSITLMCCDEMEVKRFIIENNTLLSLCSNKDSMEKSVCVWNIATKTKLHSIVMGCTYDLRHSFLVNKYLCLYKGITISEFFYVKSLELWDYMKGTLAFSASNLNTTSYVANKRFVIASRLCKIGMLCMRTGNFIDDLHVPIVNYELSTKVEVTDTKLLYVIRKHSSVVFYVRDFET